MVRNSNFKVVCIIERSAKSITMPQVTMIFMLAIGLNNHVIIIPVLLNAAGRDSWFAVCLSTLLFIVAMVVIQFIIHFSKQQNIGLWLRKHIGTMPANCLLCLMALPLLSGAIVTLRDTVTWARIYLPTTPTWALVIPLIALCFYSAYSGIGSIAITSGLLFPLVVVFGFFVGTSNLPHKDFSLLFPLLEHGGTPVLRGIFYSTCGFSELFAILYIQHYVKTDIRYWMLAVNVLLLAWLTLGPLYGAITEFGPIESARLRYPPYEEWRLVTFGHFFEHFDFLALYQWMSGALIRISFMMFLIVDIFGIRKGKKRSWGLIILFGASMVFVLIPLSSMQFFYLFKHILIPGALYCFITAALLLFIVSWWLSRKEYKPN